MEALTRVRLLNAQKVIIFEHPIENRQLFRSSQGPRIVLSSSRFVRLTIENLADSTLVHGMLKFKVPRYVEPFVISADGAALQVEAEFDFVLVEKARGVLHDHHVHRLEVRCFYPVDSVDSGNQ